MKLLILSLITFLLSVEAFAQIRRPAPRGPRYNPPGSYTTRTPTRVVVRSSPRYVPSRTSTRVIRTTRRSPIVWSGSSYGYTCSAYGELYSNGSFIHQFRYSSDCSQALSDIRYYGDFCDSEDLYDQTGYLQAQFSFSSECRNALGYYY